ncbi:hypothetical protein DFR50_11479 [Roseiarcus fermentans]|uniref:Uncharacterized protein n=1 Tax=Roseiarcus fermentans TaxID=1473586 RepID=A0A366FE77_9HYPH|nr:hypothetical protein [Roseiarcus fermentans]RBP12250.1 hypothetical protein DFR50_11479 [Roseiarcus fermentans]
MKHTNMKSTSKPSTIAVVALLAVPSGVALAAQDKKRDDPR